MKSRNLLLMFALAAFSWSLNAQDVITLTGSAVAEVSEADPDADQDDADLMIQSVESASYHSFVMFDVSSVSGDVGYAAVKFYMAQHEEKSGAGLITPARVMLLPVDNTDWDATLTWNQASTNGLINKDNYALAYIDVKDYNKDHLTGIDSKWYTVSNALVTNYINSKIAEGAGKVAFALVAMDTIPEHDIWTGGTWKTPELILQNSVAPEVLDATDVAELLQETPDAATADAGDLRIQKTSIGKDVISLLKFDLSNISDPVTNVAIQVYGAQHEDEASLPALDEYIIEVYEANSSDWAGNALTYNMFNSVIGHAEVGVTTFDMNNPNQGATNLRGVKSKIISGIRLTDLVNSYIEAGKTELSLVFKSGVVNDDFDAWFGGTWKGPQMVLEFGKAPVTYAAVNDGEVNSTLPDGVNPDDAAGDLKIQTKTNGDVIRSYIKFDLLGVDLENIRQTIIQVYGAQHEDTEIPARYLIDIYGVDNIDKIDNTSLTYNISETFTQSAKALGRIDLPLNAVNNKVSKYRFFDQQALTDYVIAKMTEGATEVGFVLEANETNDNHDAYIGGVAWKGPELKVLYNNVSASTFDSSLVQGQSLAPIQDSWVGEKESFQNHNGEADMNVTKISGDSREAFIKFQIDGSSKADLISLDLIGAQKDDDTWTALDNFYVDVYGCDDNSWDEAGIIWSNKPALSTEALASNNINVTSSITFSFASQELTDYINARIDDGDQYVTLAVAGKYETPGARAWFSSKDWKSPSLNLLYKASNDIAKPTFSTEGGTFTPQTISITLETTENNGSIYYTVDGSVPTSESTLYSQPFSIVGADGDVITVKAVTIVDGTRSNVVTEEYFFGEQKPYNTSPFSIPGTVIAWQYDLGGQGVAYNELSPDDLGDCGDAKSSLFDERSDNGLIDGCFSSETNRGDIGWASTGEWTEYTIQTNEAGCFTASLLYLKATNDYPGSLIIHEVDDNNNIIRVLVDTMIVSRNTEEGNWGADPFELTPVDLDTSFNFTAGEHVIRVTWVGDNWNFAALEFHPSTDCPADTTTIVEQTMDSFEQINLYPNPVSGRLNLDIVSDDFVATNITVRDITGRVVLREPSLNLISGSNQLSIDVSRLTRGVYFLGIENHGKLSVRKFIVNNK